MKDNLKKIYYINRYDLFKTERFRQFSGYEQVVKHSNQFIRVKSSVYLQKFFKKSWFKQVPKDYLFTNLNLEL